MNDLITRAQTQTMTSLQIAELTGKRHDAILRDIRNLLDQGVTAHNFVASEYTDSTGRTLPCYQLTKKGTLILASGYNAVLRERIIDRWEELETDRLNCGQIVGPGNPHLQLAQSQLFLLREFCADLRLNDASRLGMYQALGAQYSLTLPDYVPSKGVVRSAKDLLKEIGSTMSAIRFNKLLFEHGFIEQRSRPSAGKEEKRFWSITAKGQPYGENCVSPKNQNETQPKWYADRFRDLYQAVAGSPVDDVEFENVS